MTIVNAYISGPIIMCFLLLFLVSTSIRLSKNPSSNIFNWEIPRHPWHVWSGTTGPQATEQFHWSRACGYTKGCSWPGPWADKGAICVVCWFSGVSTLVDLHLISQVLFVGVSVASRRKSRCREDSTKKNSWSIWVATLWTCDLLWCWLALEQSLDLFNQM